MRAAVLLLALLFSLPLSAHDWSPIVTRVERSLVRVTHAADAGGHYTCAGFVINTKQALIMTAHHCLVRTREDKTVATLFQVEGLPGYLVGAWENYDIVIVSAPIPATPSLGYRRKPIRKALPVAVVGFAYGLRTSMVLTGAIAAPGAFWSEGEVWQTTDFPSIGGMSGGPIFDMDGRVVGVMQQTDSVTGISRPLAEIVRVTQQFWD